MHSWTPTFGSAFRMSKGVKNLESLYNNSETKQHLVDNYLKESLKKSQELESNKDDRWIHREMDELKKNIIEKEKEIEQIKLEIKRAEDSHDYKNIINMLYAMEKYKTEIHPRVVHKYEGSPLNRKPHTPNSKKQNKHLRHIMSSSFGGKRTRNKSRRQ